MADSTAILDRLIKLHPRAIDLSLGRMERLLEAIGHPEKRLPPVLHVAGTNGKGSTGAFMRSILEASGLAVHVYTSPHLVRFHERIRLGKPGGGHFVDEDILVQALLDCEAANSGEPITLFEITTAAALKLFADHPADVLIMEVGLGGRLDATNVIDEPLVSVITPVSVDHEGFLGSSITGIAKEKAGILKSERPGILAPQTDEVRDTIETIAASLSAPLSIANQDWQVYEENGRMIYQDTHGLMDLPMPRLPGHHQIWNAGTAIAALRAAHYLPDADVIERGLLSTTWPARMQRLTEGHFVEQAGSDVEIWVDGGHNPGAGIVIAQALADLEERSPKPLYMIAGMINTKEPVGYFKPFTGLARTVIAVPVTMSDAGIPPVDLIAFVTEAGLNGLETSSLSEAFDLALKEIGDGPARILFCGSLYLAGEVLEQNGTLPA
ncbi:bifunctional folylpolyglutamate synthase/dihydrofolate synthase [Coralliovum pocilloporae]|uniref:bifunctional folylpolyglutamate synthase/dihydrofolate synthase n=1 Tax=Coralliovum pocilloporae TaxID=3066369 RepID=UPI0033075B75